uniref:Hemoglobinase n=1 Tax=Platynereis dumerilii TaxID=6359 RepID=A0A0A7MA39_PLADU|nr:legumain-protease-precursor [Platynereis dumerilii]
MKLLVILAILGLSQAFDENVISSKSSGKHWALLIAGSNSYFNYRHQADVCHAYHILSGHGIPDERIVVMMYDDIAYSEENPTPGIIINHPNGSDVYGGVPKDYTGDDVTPKNFLNILTGNKEAMQGIGSGKVIESGPDDFVFVNFADHGAPGLVAFPNDVLNAPDLMNAIMDMYNQKKYDQLVLYIEACESGSMFDGLLPQNISVFATTAANPRESSYACYYDNKRNTYLGDLYSVNWMEDSDKEDLSSETLQDQFKIVKSETNESHVMEYGDLSIGQETVAIFQGNKQGPKKKPLPKARRDAVKSEEVPLAILYHRLQDAKTERETQNILNQIYALKAENKKIVDSFRSIAQFSSFRNDASNYFLNVRNPLKNFDCYLSVAQHYDKKCFRLPKYDYALRHLYVLVNLCEEGVMREDIINAIDKTCQ